MPSPASEIALPLRIGTRTVWTLRRRLVRRALSLEQALAATPPELPSLDSADGYLITSLPAAEADRLRTRFPELQVFVRQRYRRSYASLGQPFDSYLAGFSAKSRSTLKRKQRRLAERSGGTLDLRCYRTEAEVAHFHDAARRLSARTYQERRLGAGLPDGADAVAEMKALARRGAMRAWLLFVDGEPVSYLYAPADGKSLIYAHLGYDPDFAEYSPGTVLQLEAMRQLMDEGGFAWFDFTEGDGQHKRLFATGGIDCVDLLLVRRTAANLLTGHAVTGFDRGVAFAKRLLGKRR